MVRLLLLLLGEAQFVAQQLQLMNLLEYVDLKQAILQSDGRTPNSTISTWPPVCNRPAEERGAEDVVDLVVLEQFVAPLPQEMAQ